MIRSNRLSVSAPLNKGEYIVIGANTNIQKGSISNNQLVNPNDIASTLIGIKGYNTVSIGAGTLTQAVAFNDESDATQISIGTSGADISAYSYLMLCTSAANTFTFA